LAGFNQAIAPKESGDDYQSQGTSRKSTPDSTSQSIVGYLHGEHVRANSPAEAKSPDRKSNLPNTPFSSN
jgi:hypothetical protein